MNKPRLLISAGPTQEPIDEVRFIGNRSSGRMGIALAQAAQSQSLPVTFLLGPIETADQPDYSRLNPARFRTAADLETLLRLHWPEHDILLMAAAVADYRPAMVPGKLRRKETALTIRLEPVPDLLAQCAASARPNQFVAGFALEPDAELRASAAEKITRKKADLIVANPLQTVGSTTIEATLIVADPSGPQLEPLPTMSKLDFAKELIRRCVQLWEGKRLRSSFTLNRPAKAKS